MTPRSDDRRLGPLALGALALLALAARLSWVLAYGQHHPQASRPVIDERSYDAWARRIAAGDWLGEGVFFQEPLYPYLLGAAYRAFGADPAVARGLNVALALVFVLVTARIAALISGRRAGLLVGAVAALATPLVHTTALILKPSLFLALSSLLALGLLRERAAPSRGRAAGIGALGALAALVRGNALLLLPLVVAWPLVRRALEPAARRRAWRDDARRMFWAAAGAACVLAPVALRNGLVGGVFTPTTSGAGTNLYVGNHPSNPWGVATELPFVRGIPEHEADDWRREAERRLGRALDAGEVSRYWLGETLREFKAEPLAHAALLGRKLRLALHHGEVADNHSLTWDRLEVRERAGRPTALDLPAGGWFPWGALGIAGALLALVSRRFGLDAAPNQATCRVDLDAARELAVLALAYLATLVATVVVGRMRLPLLGLVLPLVPIAPWAAQRAWNGGQRRAAAGAAALLALTAALALAPARPAALVADDEAERDFNLAVQLLDEGAHAAALERARPLLARADSARVRALIAEATLGEARTARASGDETRALDRAGEAHALLAALPLTALGDRTAFHVRAVLGQVELVLGARPEAAVQHLEAALAFDPDEPALALALLRARAQVAARSGSDLEPLRAAAARLAQGGGERSGRTEGSERLSARLLWAELEWRVGLAAGAQERVRTALQILQGTLQELPSGAADAAAVRLLAAEVQASIGNDGAARRLLEALLAEQPDHAAARQRLAGLAAEAGRR